MRIPNLSELQPRKAVKAEVLRGPFDPGGQPSLEQRHPLHLSLFAWNVRSGLAATKAVLDDPQRYRDFWEWPASRDLLLAAERVGFDSQLQYGMWSGYAGPSGWNTASLDWATAAAVSAAVTERIGLFTTSHVGFDIHPLVVAKTTAAIDHVSGGRLGVNLVSAVDLVDYAQFGFGDDRHPLEPEALAKGVGRTSQERYAMADEFATLLKYLWTSEEGVDFEGEYFQAYGAFIDPKPRSSPRPILMNAAASDLGIDFATRQCDAIFISPGQLTVQGWQQAAKDIQAAAASHGRKVRICMMCFVVVDDTDEKAAQTVEWLGSQIDDEAVINQFRRLSGSGSGSTMKLNDEHLRKFGLGLGGYQLFGSYETVANELAGMNEAGIEHVALGFWDPLRSVETFGRNVIPLLRERGLRSD